MGKPNGHAPTIEIAGVGGVASTAPPIGPILVRDLALQNDQVNQVCFLMLGKAPFAMRAALSAMEARQLANALEEHARLLDAAASAPETTGDGNG